MEKNIDGNHRGFFGFYLISHRYKDLKDLKLMGNASRKLGKVQLLRVFLAVAPLSTG